LSRPGANLTVIPFLWPDLTQKEDNHALWIGNRQAVQSLVFSAFWDGVGVQSGK
jgi:hypothetical protein